MHHPRPPRVGLQQILLASLLVIVAIGTPDSAMAQASPFMTGATALQTNARVAREYLVALPVELSPPQRLELVRGFSQELSDRYGFAVDFAVHAPRDFPGSDPRNFHAHLLATTREVKLEGLAAKTTLEMRDGDRRKLGLPPVINELLHVRQRWAAVTNEALQQSHIAARIDHRSLEAQGIDREPRPHIPRAAFEMERHGYRSVVADRMRQEFEERLQVRGERAAGRDEHVPSEQALAKPTAAEPAVPESTVPGPANKAPVAKPQSLEEIRREARENWLRLRQSQRQSEADSAPVVPRGRVRNDDLTR
jgi:ATP-dependent exoDNAse (exonuclease V) alpha subunit